MVSFRFPCKIGSVDVQMKKFVSKMQGKREDESENHFVSNRRKGVIIVDSWFLGMSCCHQATLEAVDSSVFVFLSLVYSTPAYCFSSSRQSDQSPSLVINQT